MLETTKNVISYICFQEKWTESFNLTATACPLQVQGGSIWTEQEHDLFDMKGPI